jgi:hypothetical protein
MKEYRFIGDHAEELDGGRPIAPGDFTGLIDVEEGTHNGNLLLDGLLLEVPKGSADKQAKAQAEADEVLAGEALQSRAQELDIKGRSSMSADELRDAVAEAEANPNTKDGDV